MIGKKSDPAPRQPHIWYIACCILRTAGKAQTRIITTIRNDNLIKIADALVAQGDTRGTADSILNID